MWTEPLTAEVKHDSDAKTAWAEVRDGRGALVMRVGCAYGPQTVTGPAFEAVAEGTDEELTRAALVGLRAHLAFAAARGTQNALLLLDAGMWPLTERLRGTLARLIDAEKWQGVVPFAELRREVEARTTADGRLVGGTAADYRAVGGRLRAQLVREARARGDR